MESENNRLRDGAKTRTVSGTLAGQLRWMELSVDYSWDEPVDVYYCDVFVELLKESGVQSPGSKSLMSWIRSLGPKSSISSVYGYSNQMTH